MEGYWVPSLVCSINFLASLYHVGLISLARCSTLSGAWSQRCRVLFPVYSRPTVVRDRYSGRLLLGLSKANKAQLSPIHI
ncbi:hypothetical protein FB451DRAFT_1295175, partial [Mycena latifolia]